MSHAAQREARTARRPLLDSPLNKRPSAAPPGAAPSATSEGDLSSASSLSRPGSQSDDQGDAYTIVRFWSRVHRYQIPGLFVGGGKAVGRRRLRSFI